MSEGRTARAERGSDEGDRGLLSTKRAQRVREGADGAGEGIVAMCRAVRRAHPETDSDLMHACVMSRQPSLAPEAGSGTGGRAPAAPSVGPPVR